LGGLIGGNVLGTLASHRERDLISEDRTTLLVACADACRQNARSHWHGALASHGTARDDVVPNAHCTDD